jgi:hypothetical protein
VAEVVSAAGLEFPAALMGKIRARIEKDGELSRTQLSREVCGWMGWRAANGERRELACRLALLELEGRGELALPARRSSVRSRMPAQHREGRAEPELRCALEDLGEIELVSVSAAQDRKLSGVWNELIASHHYLGYTPLVGAQKRYLIASAQHGYLGALGFSAPARRVAVRDQWIRWSDEVRAERLQLVVCNSRFLILPWVRVANLASRVLGLAARRLRKDWQESYGYEPVLLESFVEEGRFSGISYRAANWVELGRTSGRGRQDGEHACTGTVKKVFVYPLCERWREKLGVAAEEVTGDWAEREFGTARLGDARLEQRFVSIARDFYSRPQANIPKACNGDRAKTKAVYRFLDNQDVTLAKLLEPHQQQTLARMVEHEVVLAVQDSTSLNYTAHAWMTEGLGPIGSKAGGGLGLIVHDTVAVTPAGLALGVLDAQVWVRDWEEKEAGRPIEQKESMKWLRSYQVAAQMQAQLKRTQVVSVGDREADIYELFALAREHLEAGGPHLLVRATEDRCLAETSKKLREKVEAQPVAGYREIAVPPRPGRRARTAQLSVRWCEVWLRPPQGKSALGKIRLWAVQAREQRAPAGVEPVEWLLLTTMEVGGFDQACEKLDWYVQRWMIEVFHRTLKSGCRIEHRQLGNVHRLANCLAIDMMVAARIMHLTWLGRTCPDLPCTIYFEDDQWKALSCFVSRKPTPQKKVPAIRDVIGWIAKLGGHLGRNSDRPPGTQALWEGLQRADDITETVKIFTKFAHGP